MSTLNLAQAYKWSGNQTKCEELIKSEDWSAASSDLLLGVAVLRDDFPRAVELMKKIGTSGEVKKDDYQGWPMFKEFRRSQAFIDTYTSIFKANLETAQLPEVTSALSINSAISGTDEKDRGVPTASRRNIRKSKNRAARKAKASEPIH